MSYSVDIDPGAQDAIAALPGDALLALAEAFAVLELAPWSAGRSVNPERNPDSGVRNIPFGTAGMVTYLIRPPDGSLTGHSVIILLIRYGYRYRMGLAMPGCRPDAPVGTDPGPCRTGTSYSGP